MTTREIETRLEILCKERTELANAALSQSAGKDSSETWGRIAKLCEEISTLIELLQHPGQSRAA